MATKSESKRRRERHDGSIREVVPGKKYLITCDIPTERGEKRRRGPTKTVNGTRAFAVKELKAMVTAANDGKLLEKGVQLYSALVAAYLATKRRSKQLTTYENYKRNFETHILPVIGSIKCRKLDAEHIGMVLDQAVNRSRTGENGSPLSGKTKANLLVYMRGSLEWGVRNEWVSTNKAALVEPPLVENVERPPVDLIVFQRLLEVALGSPLFAIIAVALGTGMRRGELLGWKWKDVDLESRSFRVLRSMANFNFAKAHDTPERRFETKDVKTKKALRSEYLPAFVAAVLGRHRDEQDSLYRKLGLSDEDIEASRGDRYVFEQTIGRGWDPNELSRRFTRLMQKTGIKGYRFHDLRHGYATLSQAAGVPLQVLSESMGHSQIGVTASVYVHILTQAKQDRANTLDDYAGNVASSVLKTVLPGN